MRKLYDKKSGAIICKHTPEELQQAELLRETKKSNQLMTGLCKILNISEEDLKAAVEGVETEEG